MTTESQYTALIQQKTGKSPAFWFDLIEESGEYLSDIADVITYLVSVHQLSQNCAMLVAAAYKTTVIDSTPH